MYVPRFPSPWSNSYPVPRLKSAPQIMKTNAGDIVQRWECCYTIYNYSIYMLVHNKYPSDCRGSPGNEGKLQEWAQNAAHMVPSQLGRAAHHQAGGRVWASKAQKNQDSAERPARSSSSFVALAGAVILAYSGELGLDAHMFFSQYGNFPYVTYQGMCFKIVQPGK